MHERAGDSVFKRRKLNPIWKRRSSSDSKARSNAEHPPKVPLLPPQPSVQKIPDHIDKLSENVAPSVKDAAKSDCMTRRFAIKE